MAIIVSKKFLKMLPPLGYHFILSNNITIFIHAQGNPWLKASIYTFSYLVKLFTSLFAFEFSVDCKISIL